MPEELCAFARQELRQKFLAGRPGISGCNMAVAETGSMVLVTNEGNGRMVTSLPKVHVAVMGMERVVETWEQLDLLLDAAAPGRHRPGPVSVYMHPGDRAPPGRPGEVDGPDELHLVILDNGRSELIGSELQEMLNCIRCGACLNVCPVYRQVGGHAYGWCYSGPMGAVLIPLLNRAEEAGELSGASTLCGACYEACPVKIPLQDLLLTLRRQRGGRRRPAAQRAGVEGVGRGLVPPGQLPGVDRGGGPGGPGAAHPAVPRRLDRGPGDPPGPRGALVPRPLRPRRDLRAVQRGARRPSSPGLRAASGRGAPPNLPHPIEPLPGGAIPAVAHPRLDEPPVDVFAEQAAAHAWTVRRVAERRRAGGAWWPRCARPRRVSQGGAVGRSRGRRASATSRSLGVEVLARRRRRPTRREADLGITGALFGLAATGSVVVSLGAGRRPLGLAAAARPPGAGGRPAGWSPRPRRCGDACPSTSRTGRRPSWCSSPARAVRPTSSSR